MECQVKRGDLDAEVMYSVGNFRVFSLVERDLVESVGPINIGDVYRTGVFERKFFHWSRNLVEAVNSINVREI